MTTVALKLIGYPQRPEAGARKAQKDEGPTWGACWTSRAKGGLRLVEYEQKLANYTPKNILWRNSILAAERPTTMRGVVVATRWQVLVSAYCAGGFILKLTASDDCGEGMRAGENLLE